MKNKYKSIVYEKLNPTNRKEYIFEEKIEGENYGVNAFTKRYNELNIEYPEFVHLVEKVV